MLYTIDKLKKIKRQLAHVSELSLYEVFKNVAREELSPATMQVLQDLVLHY